MKTPADQKHSDYLRIPLGLDTTTSKVVEAYFHSSGMELEAYLLTILSEVITRWAEAPIFTINVTRFSSALSNHISETVPQSCVSFFPVHQDLSDGLSLFQQYEKTRSRLGKSLAHGELEPDKISGALEIDSKAPLSLPIVLTNMLDMPSQTISDQSPLIEQISEGEPPIRMWLEVRAYKSQDGKLGIDWYYLEGLFPKDLIPQMHSAFVQMLCDVAMNPEILQKPANIALPTAQKEMIASANMTKSDLYCAALHTPVLMAAQDHASDAAITNFNGDQLTHLQLFSAAFEYAKIIRNQVPEPTPIPVLMNKGPAQIVAVLACMQAGCPYVPIDPDQGKERIQQILSQLGVPVGLVETAEAMALCQELRVQAIRCNANFPELSHSHQLQASIEHSERIDAGKPAYIIFTSGSTGKPKGVVISHSGASNTCADINKRFGIGASDSVFAISELTFDLSVYDIFGVLGAGGSLVLPDKGSHRDPAHWLKQLHDHSVTIWNSAPALMVMLVEYCEARSISLPPSLRLVLLSGDWIPPDLPKRLNRLAPSVKIISMGGATEASIWSILYEIDPNKTYSPTIPYGRAMANQSFHVLNDRMMERPVGASGKLYIGGMGLALEYFKEPELTARHFVIHPQTGERLYRTGDLGRWLPDGNIQFLGREDFQVKVQGFRIELSDIENALDRHPKIRKSLVVTHGDIYQSKKLVAYYISRDEDRSTLASKDLKQWLAQHLPAYMIPDLYQAIEKWPLSVNGKVDRKKLPEVHSSKQASGKNTDIRVNLISDIYSQILSTNVDDPEANFFALGGTSIEMVRLQNELLKRLGIEVRTADLFRFSSVSSLTAHIETLQKQDQKSTSNSAGAHSPP